MSDAVTTVRPFEDSIAPAWNDFVSRHQLGTPCHLLAWKRSLEETFGYESRYLVAESDGRITGVLPLFLISNLVVGKILLSSPFGVYGGILADSDAARDGLRDKAAELGRELGVQHVELRNAFDQQRVGFQPVDRYVTFTLPVGPRSDDELLKSLPKKTRNIVRKCLRYNYSSRFAKNLDHFYGLLTRTYRRLGTPVFPRHFYESLWSNFGDLVDVREVLLDDEVVAVSFNFRFRGELHTYYAASDARQLSRSPNNYMYFDLLRWAGNNNFGLFDFGRSKKDTGNFEFKKHWGAQPRELPYEVLLVERKEMPNFTPKNPKFELAIKVWQRLPLPLTRLLGPHLVKLFP